MSQLQPTPRRRPRHLMDPANPVPPVSRYPTDINRVQRWVLSVLLVTTLEHFAGGLVVGAVFTDPDKVDARIALNVLAGVIGVLGVVSARLIHRCNPMTWWLLLGPVPAVVGLWLTFG